MINKIERLAEEFLLAELGDPRAMSDLRRFLEEIRKETPPGRLGEVLTSLSGHLDLLASGPVEDPARVWKAAQEDVASIAEMISGSETSALSEGAPPAAMEEAEFDPEILRGFIVETREHLDAAEVQLLVLDADPNQLEALHTVFRAFHTIKGAAGCLGLEAMQALAHETENLLDLARRDGITLADRVIDVVFEALDAMKRLTSDAERSLSAGDLRPSESAPAELLLRIRQTVANASPQMAGPVPEPIPAGDEASIASSAGPKNSEDRVSMKEPVRVDADRLDRLVDLIGELVIAESMVSQSSELRTLAAGGTLSKSVSQMDKITRELHEMGMSLRMVPVRPLFQKMARLARDVSRKLAKPIEFVTTGEDIEIDKAIVPCVADALVHIIRNAIDHGIEATPGERTRRGKGGAGRIELRALHREGSIVIEVQDDGRGLDPEAILSKGIEKGIVRKGEALAEEDIFKLVFLPGFSTAAAVTELSGRGVGLDVVRTSVEALRGRIEVHSARGRGTTFRLRLPLTLAIIDGMVIRAGNERYVVPTLSITRLVRPGPEHRATLMDRDEMLLLQEELVPLFRLGRLLDVSEAAPEAGSGVAVVVEDAGRRAALLADEVLGQQQVVIKSLGMDLEGVSGISGAVILPDGQVGLMLDVNGLLARRSSSAVCPAGASAANPR